MTRHGATPRRQWPTLRLPRIRLPVWLVLALSATGLALGAIAAAVHWWPESEPAAVDWAWSGDWVYLDDDALHEQVARYTEQGFWELSLQDIQGSIRQLPWVDDVRVERHWPQQLTVAVKEQVPLARWNENALLNNRGEAFRPETPPEIELAWLRGPEGQAGRVMNHYLLFSRLFSHLDTAIVALSMADRGAWRLELAGGVIVELGQKDLLQRARRVAKVLESVAREDTSRRITRIDTRYQYAVAVAWESGDTA